MSDTLDNGTSFGGDFSGSVEASAPGGGGGYGNTGNTNGAADGFGAGGYATTPADLAQLGAVGAAVLGNAPVAATGIVISAGVTQNTGSNPYSAVVNLTHDMSLGLGQAVTANPTISMYQTSVQTLASMGLLEAFNAGNAMYPTPSGGGGQEGGQ